MSLTLHIDRTRWQAHLNGVRQALPVLVPVIKGNGYGFGQVLAAGQAARLEVPTVAVGVASELREVLAAFPGDVLLLEPWDDSYAPPPDRFPEPGRVVVTVSSPTALRAVAKYGTPHRPVRAVLEGLSSLRRFGLTPEELTQTLEERPVADAVATGRLLLLGLGLHLPMTQPDAGSPVVDTHGGTIASTPRVREVVAWSRLWEQVVSDHSRDDPERVAPTLWVSHLELDEVATLRALVDVELRHRVGSRLWLGARHAYAPRSTVLAVHDVAHGTHIGYRQRRVPRRTRLLVAGGGTAHGIALTAPSPAASLRQRAVAAGTGALDAAGRALSPFSLDGHRLWFAEPPHAQVSLLWLPQSVPVPQVGDELDVELRMTTARFDEVRMDAPPATLTPPRWP